MAESVAHLALKKAAMSLLQEQYGFKTEEIFLEYRIGSYRVDVAGIRPDLRVAIEVGNILANKDEKLAYLESKFDHVHRILYTSYINPALPAEVPLLPSRTKESVQPRMYIRTGGSTEYDKLIADIRARGWRVDIIDKKPANPKKDGNRRVISLSVKGDSKIFLGKLDQMLKLEGKTRSEWYCEQVVNFVSQNMHY